MKSAKQLREEISALADRVQAIVDLATAAANRALTTDETAEVARIQGRGKAGEADYIKGEIDLLKVELDQADRLEARQLEIAQARTKGPGHSTGPIEEVDAGSVEPFARVARIVIPARCSYRHKPLKNFHGPHAEQTAFLAGMFYLATLGQSESAKKWCTDHGIDTKFRGALRESDNQLGGFLVPEEVERTIIDLRLKYGVFRQDAFVTPMGSDTKSVPRRATGLTAYFVAEGVLIPESDKSWDMVGLVAKKLAVLTRWSSELDEDAIIDLGDDLTSEISYAFSKKEDECGFIGDGTSTYGGMTGVVNAVLAGSIYTALAGNTGFETLDYADFEAVVGMLPEYAESNAKWYVSKRGMVASMMRLLDASGGNTIAMLEAGAGQKIFLGYPIVTTPVLNSTLGADVSVPKVIFGDLRLAATFGNRRGVTVRISDERYFDTDQLAIKGTERFDINVHERGTATEPGAIIVMKTPGA